MAGVTVVKDPGSCRAILDDPHKSQSVRLLLPPDIVPLSTIGPQLCVTSDASGSFNITATVMLILHPGNWKAEGRMACHMTLRSPFNKRHGLPPQPVFAGFCRCMPLARPHPSKILHWCFAILASRGQPSQFFGPYEDGSRGPDLLVRPVQLARLSLQAVCGKAL